MTAGGERERAALWALLLVAAAERLWNVCSVPPLLGYDAPGHAAYVLGILETGRLPHPLSGWSTFHPPLYYLLGAAVWRALAPFGPQAVVAGLRSLGAFAGLAAGLVAHRVVRRLGGDATVAWVATALVLFVPVAQMSATMVGNEAFAAGVAALALPPLLRLQEEPRDLRAAALGGLAIGFALAAKFTGLFVAAAWPVPFLRRGLDRRALGAFAAGTALIALVAAPVYVRNVVLVGSPIPMTREREPMRSAEDSQVLRPRQPLDYLRVTLDCINRPAVEHWELLGPATPLFRLYNRRWTSVWGLTYATWWNDAFGHRMPWAARRRAGPVLAWLGIVPTALLLLGFAAALLDLLRRGARAPDAPLVAMAVAGVAVYVAFTWRAPSMAALKGSYLLPLAAPAAAFFARGAALLGRRLRAAALAVSVAAALAAALAFTDGLFVTSLPMEPSGVRTWGEFAKALPGSHVAAAADYFFGAP